MSRLFRRPYPIRRYGKQTIVNGYAVNNSNDFITRLNVQPLSKNDLMALPEGERTVKRVKSFGSTALISADEHTGTLGDLLFYNEQWYECVTCVHWQHTALSHYEAEFVLLKDQTKQPPPETGGDTIAN